MKGIFVVFHGMSAYSGISKKIASQCAALCRNGIETRLCRLDVSAEGRRRRLVGDQVVSDFGCGMSGRLLHRLSFGELTRYIRREGIGFVYIRYDHNANPFTIRWFRALKHAGVKIALEIPTYPYDSEYRGQPLGFRVGHFFDRCFRGLLMRSVDRIITFSDDSSIFGRPTIRISNGIDFAAIPLKKAACAQPGGETRLLGVANIHTWHGFDRVIAGMAAYYRTSPERIVRFTIVGDGDPALLESFRRAARENGIAEYVELTGPLSGEALDAAFEQADLGIASLGRHRNGIVKLRTLKNREYAARGIPFVYSEQDDDFDAMPYVLKVPADDSPLDIRNLLRFGDEQHMPPAAIRASIEHTLSWDKQMERVIKQMELR